MNFSNAVGFLFLGLVMLLAPMLVPALFAHVAIDGASTRALWTEFMGLVEFLIGAGYVVRQGLRVAIEAGRNLAEQRGAVATGEWQPAAVPGHLVFVDLIPAEVAKGARAFAMTSLSAAEARITNLVGRPGRIRQIA